MMMPGRQYSGSVNYRFGFNSQEKSTELNYNGNSYTAEFWEYDSRLSKRWNLDPVPRSMVSPYVVLGNNPIIYLDPNGADWYYNKRSKETKWFDGDGKHKGFKHLGATYSGWTSDGSAYIHYGNKGKDDITVVNKKEMESITISTTIKKSQSNCTCTVHSLKFNFSGSGKVDIGPQIGFKTKVGGAINFNAKAGGNVELVSGTTGYNPNGNDGWQAYGNYVGKNETFVTRQFANVELTSNKGLFGAEYGLGAKYEETGISYSNGKFVSKSQTQITIGVPMLRKNREQDLINKVFEQHVASNKFYSPNITSPNLKAKGSLPLYNNFAGLDLEFGGALGIGFELKIKVGFNY